MKIRLIEKENKWYVQKKSINTLGFWSNIDYFFTLEDGEDYYKKMITTNMKPIVLKEHTF